MVQNEDKVVIIVGELNDHNSFVLSPENHSKISPLKRRLRDLEQLKLEFRNVTTELGVDSLVITNDEEQTSSQSDPTPVEYNFKEISNKFYETLAMYDSIIESFEKAQISPSDSSNNVNNAGNYTEWASFFDTFSSLIDSNHGLSDMQKLHYLKACLTDEPKRTVESLKTDNGNYLIALDLLKQRFENKRMIINNHLKQIFDLPFIQKNDYKSLRAFLDQFTINLTTLEKMNRPVKQWSDMLVYIISTKLDHFSSETWEESIQQSNEMPTHVELVTFLEKRCQMLESIHLHKTQVSSNNDIKFNTGIYSPSKSKQITLKKRAFYTKAQNNTKQQTPCFICSKLHSIFNCQEFLNVNPRERFQLIRNMNRCSNCFRQNHITKDCKGSCCKVCSKKHHSLLHFEDNTHNTNKNEESVNEFIEKIPEIKSQCNLVFTSNVLLPTAEIQVVSPNGKTKKCRALLDIGSQSHFISEKLCKFLEVPVSKVDVSVMGINSQTKYDRLVRVEIKSNVTDFKTYVECLVIPEITGNLPSTNLNINQLHLPENIELADPKFHCSAPIDLLLGAELFLSLLTQGKISLGKAQPVLQNTVFGWIIGGAINKLPGVNTSACYKINLNENIARFWELENVGTINDQFIGQFPHNPCERHFEETHLRSPDGRFMVKLPFKEFPPKLGLSREMALKRLLSVERKRERDPKLNAGYVSFMKTYLELDHMELVQNDLIENSFYLPHSCVINENSSSTKLRVVFDGSCKSSNNLSLNDNLLAGPVIQPDLFTILIQFRLYQYVMTTDISKMYRCIWVHPDDRNYQKILWRETPESPIETYRLKTVTYGLTPSSYQAIKCVQQIGYEEQHRFPLAFSIIMNCFYVDDALFGANSISQLVEMKQQLTKVLSKAGFELSKWGSNCSDALDHERDAAAANCIIIDKHQDKKTLGISWDTNKDHFLYKKSKFAIGKTTKRAVMSAISQLFDPLGLINPVITKAKIIMQQLWAEKLDWDDEIPQNIYKMWIQFVNDLPNLNKFQISRCVICCDPIKIELHGFCDSSEQAYGASIFVRSVDVELNVHVKLLCAKSRVAPLKTISLPRLELCGALLLAQLIAKVSKTLDILPENCHFWTDSQIVLAWLSAEPRNWKTFISNRVSEIQQLTKIGNWQHVKGTENPADVITRGALPSELINNELWFGGPSWLHQLDIQNSNNGDTGKNNYENQCEVQREKKIIVGVTIQQSQSVFNLLTRYSTFFKLIKAVAYWKRLINTLQCKIKKQPAVTGRLTLDELEKAKITIIKLVQSYSYADEIKQLKKNQKVEKSTIASLNPFLDADEVIRVGGRLGNSSLPYHQKFPILLPKHFVTDLIIEQTHINLLHAGQMGTLAHLRLNYWPISGRSQVRKIIRRCMNCFKINPKPYTQIMGNLPSVRTMPARPFLKSGVDFGGPLLIKEGRGRGKRTVKAYICLFVCLVTKAIHLELVGDLTTESFLNALKRLISRRGNVSFILSDNATNFVGANRELKKLIHSDEFHNTVRQENIKWEFIPPRAPHFGGIWESGIKSVKGHIKRVIGENHLTYEEMYTLLVRVEAVLNSRPLAPLSNDVNDLAALTPGHFLIGHPITAPIEKDHTDIKTNRLSRWQLIEACRQHFWKRWSSEYLTTLQNRTKWTKTSSLVPQVGALVVVKDDQLPPLQWQLGRIVEVFPGKDDLVRVVSVRCKSGVIKRSIAKLCPLPVDTNEA